MAGNPNWQKGQSGNPEGRPTGSANKTTREIREKIGRFIEGKADDLGSLYNDLKSPTLKAKFLLGLMPYVVPRRKEIIEEIAPEAFKIEIEIVESDHPLAKKYHAD